MKTCEDILPYKNITVHDFLYNYTPAYTTWIIKDNGWKVAIFYVDKVVIFYVDNEDLWSGWFPQQHKDKYVKSYSYDENTKIGIIEIKEVSLNE